MLAAGRRPMCESPKGTTCPGGAVKYISQRQVSGIGKRARLSNGSFALQLEAGRAITRTNDQIAANEETIDETNRLLSQIQHSTDAFIALQIDLVHSTNAFLAV